MTTETTPAALRLSEGLGPEADCKQATPLDVLMAQLMNPNVPKSEREHVAVREIERLLAELNEAIAALPQAIRNERERCANIAESWQVYANDRPSAIAVRIAAAIRGPNVD